MNDVLVVCKDFAGSNKQRASALVKKMTMSKKKNAAAAAAEEGGGGSSSGEEKLVATHVIALGDPGVSVAELGYSQGASTNEAALCSFAVNTVDRR